MLASSRRITALLSLAFALTVPALQGGSSVDPDILFRNVTLNGTPIFSAPELVGGANGSNVPLIVSTTTNLVIEVDAFMSATSTNPATAGLDNSLIVFGFTNGVVTTNTTLLLGPEIAPGFRLAGATNNVVPEGSSNAVHITVPLFFDGPGFWAGGLLIAYVGNSNSTGYLPGWSPLGDASFLTAPLDQSFLVSIEIIPEPATAAVLLLTGLGTLARRRRR
jgi:hypothetical protein